jgi:hypothetical protein
MATPSEQPPTEQPPVEQPPTEQPPVEQPPTEQPPAEQPPTEQPPLEVPPVESPIVEDGSFGLIPGREVRHLYTGDDLGTSGATVEFGVPKNIGSGVMYQSLQVLSSEDGRAGYRATVTLRTSGSIRLTVAQVVGNRSRVLKDVVVAPRGSYSPGESVQVALTVEDGSVLAKSWVVGDTEPDWQINARADASGASLGDDVVILGYLSKRAPHGVFGDWSGLSPSIG